MNYQDWKLEDIIKWCQENNQVEWLKATAAKKVESKTYPRIESVSKTGRKSWKLDKTAAPVITERPISFVELKKEFISTFIEPDKKSKKLSMYEIIAAL